MKITRTEKKLFEAKLFESDADVGIDTSDSVGEIAADVVDAVETGTGGAETMSKDSASKVASEIKAVAAETGIDTAAVAAPEGYESLGVENKITKVLDMSLNLSKKNKRRGSKSGYNVLVIGLPGSGKTASIMDWAESRGVNLVAINAKNNDLDAYINGYTTKDPSNPRKVFQAFSDNLANLEKENSVLFLDEYNRQVKPHIRASLYTLINEHKIVGEGPNGLHEFKNLLFTIAAINPSVKTDKGAAPLNDAEKSRFWWTLEDMDSDAATTLEYLTKYYTKRISLLDSSSENYREDLEDYLRILDLGTFLVSHPKFYYNSEDDLEDLEYSKKTLLCQRAITTGLHNSNGDVEQFKFWVEEGSNFLPKDIENIVKILREYVVPTFEDLCRGHGIDGAAVKAAEEPKSEVAATSSFGPDVEDDDDFFVSSDKVGKVRVKNPYEVELAIASAVKDW